MGIRPKFSLGAAFGGAQNQNQNAAPRSRTHFYGLPGDVVRSVERLSSQIGSKLAKFGQNPAKLGSFGGSSRAQNPNVGLLLFTDPTVVLLLLFIYMNSVQRLMLSNSTWDTSDLGA